MTTFLRAPLLRISAALMLVSIFLPTVQAQKQTKEERKAMMKDSLDGKLDFSKFLIDAHGFIPVPFIITEPALGGFGGALVPMFITPKKNISGRGYQPPDITAGFGMYTSNGSWGVGVFRSGSLPNAGLKYRVGGGYSDINISFYRTLPAVGEKEFAFNMEAIPVSLSLSKKITHSGLYAGVQYAYLRTKLKPRFQGSVPDFIEAKELDNNISTIGTFLEWDKRNTIFTPDKGIIAHLAFTVNDDWTGSDFSYQKLLERINWFTQVKSNWVSGLRFEGIQAFGNPPFFLLPGISMRGIAAARYQGQSTYLVETEQRFDLNLRWSVLGFAGYGTAIAKNEKFGSGKNVYNVGGGLRYLLARSFRLRTGIDVAKGPDSWAWYITFGHAWNR